MRPKCSYWVGHHSPTGGKESPEQDSFQGQLLLILHWQRPLSTQLRCKQLRVRQGMLTHVDTWLGYRLQSGYLPQGLLHHSFSQGLSLLEVCYFCWSMSFWCLHMYISLLPELGWEAHAAMLGIYVSAENESRSSCLYSKHFIPEIFPTPFVVNVPRMHQNFTIIWNISFNYFLILNILHNFGLL